ncbi:MAG: heparinase [Gammaproteobacteria bacterium]|nr:MAG: heparinase [Gammaproteobacteria bacterium]
MCFAKLSIKIKTAVALGLPNLARVFLYRIGVKLGFNPIKKIIANIAHGVFFDDANVKNNVDLPINSQWQDQQYYFGWQVNPSADIPNWHRSVLTHCEVKDPLRNWWQIADFDAELGDIKGVWEASRFDWVLCFAQQAATGNKQALDKLNTWLLNWVEHNPPYQGVNWKCGQEASIRVMNLAMASVILASHNKTNIALCSLIKAHLQRIAPTLSYAMAQDNNHGTSEAAALYVGGSWLVNNGVSEGYAWQKLGGKWLENRAKKLIENDGSFSQYSTTYHRVMLDTFSMVEVWRKQLDLPLFSNAFYQRIKLATHWLYQLTQETTGDAPNLGANDGARLLPLTSADYRDFRPSVQLASVLFLQKKAWSKEGEYDLPLQWLKIVLPQSCLTPVTNFHFDQGGYFGLRSREGKAFLMMTYPKFRFRPSQCDALHVDFWLEGQNLLRDGGTFSYNAGDQYINYYGGTESHNTIQFDHSEQMPRLSRFLLGGWLKAKDIYFNSASGNCQASYTDLHKNKHLRNVTLNDKILLIEDVISGFNQSAILRWRLQPGTWKVDGHSLTNGKQFITVHATASVIRFELITGKESRYYYQETEVPVLEVELAQAGSIITEYKY